MIALLLDVGGFKTKALIVIEKEGKYKKIKIEKELGSLLDLKDFVEDIIKLYLKSKEKIFLFSDFAGRVFKERGLVSVSKWGTFFWIEEIFPKTIFKNVFFCNDLEAAFYGLGSSRSEVIMKGKRKIKENRKTLLVYLGSGMGVSFQGEPSEFCSAPIPIDIYDPLESKLLNCGEIKFEDVLSGGGLSFLAKKLNLGNFSPVEVSQGIVEGKYEVVGELFTKILAKAVKILSLTFLPDVVFLGGKPLSFFSDKFYNLFIGEFLKDEANREWLKEIEVRKLKSCESLPLKGLFNLALKVFKYEKSSCSCRSSR